MAQDAAAQSMQAWPAMTRQKKPLAHSRTKLRMNGTEVSATKSVDPKPADDAVSVSAFDIWLERGLHKIFDDVAKEPIPPELLRLIEVDRQKSKNEDDD